MAEVTQELMYEILKQIQSDIRGLREGQREHNTALNALRTHMVALQQDVQNLYSIAVRQDARLDRIERRLEISEVTS
jgi:hypothetical protein